MTEKDQIKCVHCGAMSPKSNVQCWKCNKKLAESHKPEPPKEEKKAEIVVAAKKPSKLPKGVCPDCGTKNPVARKFCSNCGANLTGEVKCPSCNTINKKDEKFCGECGKPLSQAPQKPKGPTCIKCEAELDPNSAFCPECGVNNKSAEAKLSVASEKYPLPPELGIKDESEGATQGEPITAEEIRGLELMDGEKLLHKVTVKRMFDVVTPPSIYITNERLIKRVPKTLGLRSSIEDYSFGDMANVSVHKGLFGSDIIIKMRFNSEDFVIQGVPKAEAKTVHTLIRSGITGRLR
jgi:predicted amidophosphoribosyltransferase